MVSTTTLLLLAHLIGLCLAVGAATTKVVLLLKSRSDVSMIPVFIRVSRPITRLIIVGLAVLSVSGVCWLLLGYPLSDKLIVKLVLVVAVWALGPYIDNAIEPKFKALAAEISNPLSPEFLRVQKRYLTVEFIATGIFYAVIILWVAF